ncbi:energy transducer TonB [Oleomonas cavernae]|uniref:Energy transducer TonB n=1 Tax=Oleomonas cavernae TaxID=2320859 RepID=A0A418W8K6_9PROT|nr:energy transducer TonB [Oleomonas cavernae]
MSVAVHLGAGIAVYSLTIDAPVLPEEKPIEMVLVAPELELPPPQAVTEPPPPEVVEPPPPEVAAIEPPPPPVIAQAIEEPVEAPPPPPPPPPKPKVAKPPKPVPPKPAAVAPANPAPVVPAVTAPPPAAVVAPPKPEGIPTAYAKDVRTKISRYAINKYPRAAVLKEQEGRIGYSLTLAPDGHVLGVEITKPSGFEALDNAAAEAVRNAGPYPALPSLGGTQYRLDGAIVYKLP